MSRAKAGGLALTGEGGVLAQLTKRLLESALEGEITDHLGYDKHDPAGRGTGNSRNRHPRTSSRYAGGDRRQYCRRHCAAESALPLVNAVFRAFVASALRVAGRC